MKKSVLVVAIVLSVVIAVLVYRNLGGDTAPSHSQQGVVDEMIADDEAREDDVDEAPNEPEPIEMDAGSSEVAVDGRWWGPRFSRDYEASQGQKVAEVYTSISDVKMKLGQTLITGGFRTADGKYGMCLITPRRETTEDGQEVVAMNSMMLAVGPEFAKAIASNLMLSGQGDVIPDVQTWIHDLSMGMDPATAGTRKFDIMSLPKIIPGAASEYSDLTFENGGKNYYIGFDVELLGEDRIGLRSQTEIKLEE